MIRLNLSLSVLALGLPQVHHCFYSFSNCVLLAELQSWISKSDQALYKLSTLIIIIQFRFWDRIQLSRNNQVRVSQSAENLNQSSSCSVFSTNLCIFDSCNLFTLMTNYAESWVGINLIKPLKLLLTLIIRPKGLRCLDQW